MKKLKLFLPALLLGLFANSQLQQIKIVSFTVKNQLPASIDSWGSTPGALIMVVQKVPNPRMVEPRLVIQLRSGGAVLCGNNAATAKPVDPFDVRTFNTADLTGFLTGCHELKEGTYTICAQFFNVDKIAISQEMCRDFRVEATNVEYAPPTLITPDNGKKFTAQELQGVVLFRWTTLVPKPREPVTYRLKVWQLMEGQNGTMAMRTNQPIVTKDVDNLTQATANGIYTGPCKPPYLCDFIWGVQALNRSGKPMGNNNGMSEAYTFGVAEEKIKGPDNIFPENNQSLSVELFFDTYEQGGPAKKPLTFTWKPVEPKQSAPVTYRLRVWQLMQGQNGTQAMRSNPPIVTKEVDNLTSAAVSNIYTGPCKPPYLCDFIWTVEASTRQAGAAPKIIGTSDATTFKITEEKSKGPDNVFPENNKKFNSTEAGREIVFRWTTLVPKPSTPVTYRIKVWQLMEGQNGKQAMSTNSPLHTVSVEMDVDQPELRIQNLYTGPCKPPYLCDFIWNVQVVTRDGTPGATSEPTVFSVSEGNGKCSANLFPEDKKKFTPEEAKREMTFRWTPNGPAPASGHYRMKVWQLMQGQSGAQAMRSNQPVVTKDVDNLTQVSVSGLYTGPCKPPYLCDFIWAVEFMGVAGQTGCTSEPTTFSVTEEASKCPGNIFPEDKKKFSPEEAKKEMTFRWTPNGPAGSGHYRMKVWQLMQGQSGAQAMRSNQPVVTKDVDNLTQVSVSGLYTGPCKPPYLCDFIWAVELMGAAGQTGCTSEPTTFSVTGETGKCPANLFPEDKAKISSSQAKDAITFRWKKNNAPGENPMYRVKVWQLMEGQSGAEAMKLKPLLDVDGNGQADALTDGLLIIRHLYTGPCKPPYLCDFIWRVEIKGAAGQTGCTSEPTTFSVTEENVKCPANTFPEDKKRIDLEEVKRSITFKWTKTETPGESSAYRLKVWQLMQGQNGTQAMKSNTPIVTKEVRNANEITVNGIITGPCKPPYLCDFIWAVEKINASGQVTCSSQPTMFFANQYIIQLDSIKVSCTAKPGVYSFKYCITNPNPGTAKLITFTATSSVPSGATIGSFSPPLNTTINSNGQLCITGTINAASNLSNICIGAAIQDVANNFWQAQKDTCVKVEPCRCDACDDKNFVMNLPKPAQINWSNNTLSFNQAITITTTPPKTIKSIRAELVYYEMIPQINDCLPCDKDASLYGHFTNGTNSQQWTGSQTSLSINITTPNVPCCSTVFKWCIRYKVEFTDCTVCSKLICYEKKKEGCTTPAGGGVGNPNNNNPK